MTSREVQSRFVRAIGGRLIDKKRKRSSASALTKSVRAESVRKKLRKFALSEKSNI